MSKNKLLYVIGERAFECIQRLSLATYTNKIKDNYFDFESYFELVYVNDIKYSLEHLKIEVENYREVFHKQYQIIYDMSEKNAMYFMTMGTSNRKELFNYWIFQGQRQ